MRPLLLIGLLLAASLLATLGPSASAQTSPEPHVDLTCDTDAIMVNATGTVLFGCLLDNPTSYALEVDLGHDAVWLDVTHDRNASVAAGGQHAFQVEVAAGEGLSLDLPVLNITAEIDTANGVAVANTTIEIAAVNVSVEDWGALQWNGSVNRTAHYRLYSVDHANRTHTLTVTLASDQAANASLWLDGVEVANGSASGLSASLNRTGTTLQLLEVRLADGDPHASWYGNITTTVDGIQVGHELLVVLAPSVPVVIGGDHDDPDPIVPEPAEDTPAPAAALVLLVLLVAAVVGPRRLQ